MPIAIGSKFRGKALFRDTQSGTFFEVLPAFSLDDERLQNSLLGYGKKKKKIQAKNQKKKNQAKVQAKNKEVVQYVPA